MAGKRSYDHAFSYIFLAVFLHIAWKSERLDCKKAELWPYEQPCWFRQKVQL